MTAFNLIVTLIVGMLGLGVGMHEYRLWEGRPSAEKTIADFVINTLLVGVALIVLTLLVAVIGLMWMASSPS